MDGNPFNEYVRVIVKESGEESHVVQWKICTHEEFLRVQAREIAWKAANPWREPSIWRLAKLDERKLS